MDYKSNSHKTRELLENKNEEIPDKKIEKAIKGTAKVKKKGGFSKFAEMFLPEDVEDVKGYIFEDIVVPAVKDIILDVVRGFLGLGFGGSSRHSAASKVSYRKYYEDIRRSQDYGPERRTRSGYDYDDVILDNRGEAEEVLSRMDELISVYGIISVADLYDLVGITGNYTDNKYGWTDIRSASIVRVRDGYLIKMPKALPLN